MKNSKLVDNVNKIVNKLFEAEDIYNQQLYDLSHILKDDGIKVNIEMTGEYNYISYKEPDTKRTVFVKVNPTGKEHSYLIYKSFNDLKFNKSNYSSETIKELLTRYDIDIQF